jgi:hypothetical protein
MLTVRRRYDAEMRNYFTDLKERHGEIPDNVKQAIDLRSQFVKQYVINNV